VVPTGQSVRSDAASKSFEEKPDREVRHELKEMTEKALFDSNDGILDPACLRKIWKQHQSGH